MVTLDKIVVSDNFINLTRIITTSKVTNDQADKLDKFERYLFSLLMIDSKTSGHPLCKKNMMIFKEELFFIQDHVFDKDIISVNDEVLDRVLYIMKTDVSDLDLVNSNDEIVTLNFNN